MRWTTGFRFPAGGGPLFFFRHCVETDSGIHPTSYPMGTEGSFLKGKVTGAWSWPLISIWCRD